MRRLRVVTACALAVAWVAIAASPALAAEGGITSSDRRISVSGDVVVARGEIVTGPVAAIDGSVRVRGTVTDYVVVGDGDLTVSGRVTRSVVVVHGDAVISGRVRGDVVAIMGRVTVTRTGSVGGDVVSRKDPHIARGTVEGEVRGVDLRGIFTGVIIGFLAYLRYARNPMMTPVKMPRRSTPRTSPSTVPRAMCGSLRETTSPPTLPVLVTVTRPMMATTSPRTRPEITASPCTTTTLRVTRPLTVRSPSPTTT